MITHLPGIPLPTESTLDINIHVTHPLNVTSFSARQRVTAIRHAPAQHATRRRRSGTDRRRARLLDGPRRLHAARKRRTWPRGHAAGRCRDRRAFDRSTNRAGNDAPCRTVGSRCRTFSRSLSIPVLRPVFGWFWRTAATCEPRPSCVRSSIRNRRALVPEHHADLRARLRSLSSSVEFGRTAKGADRKSTPIVFIQTGSLEYWNMDIFHVAVLVGLDDVNAVLNDPYFATAPQTTSLQSFEKAWAQTGQFAAFIRPRQKP